MFCFGGVVIVVIAIITNFCHAQYSYTLSSVESCPGMNPSIFNSSVGDNGLSLIFKLDRTMNDNCEVKCHIEFWKDGKWSTYTEFNGNLCYVLESFNPAWDELKMKIEPAMPDCNILPNTYTLTDYKGSSAGVEKSRILQADGKFRATETFICEEEQVSCLQIEFQVDEVE